MPLDKIAALAGVSRSTTQNALREARRLGLVTVTERRRRGAKSLTNVIEVVSTEWAAWLKLGSKEYRVQNNKPHEITIFSFNKKEGEMWRTVHKPLHQGGSTWHRGCVPGSFGR